MLGSMTTDPESEQARLSGELAAILSDASMPVMLRTLIKKAQIALQGWCEGDSPQGLAIARYAVTGWKRWRLQSSSVRIKRESI